MSCITFLDFKSNQTVCPWVRASALACIVSSPKSVGVDGFGKILSKADLERLKSPLLKPTVTTAEELLSLNWNLLQEQTFAKSPEGLSLMGRCMVRMMLHLTKKEAKGRDTTVYPDLAAISSLFGQELLELQQGKGSVAKPQAGSGQQDQPVQPQSLEGFLVL
jgi:hypothetical protein